MWPACQICGKPVRNISDEFCRGSHYGIGTVVAGGIFEKQYNIYLFWLFTIPKTRKVTKVLIEFKDNLQNTEYFLREPSECLKAVDGESSNA